MSLLIATSKRPDVKKVEAPAKKEKFVSLENMMETEPFMCTACFGTFSNSDMRGKLNVCPECGEVDSICRPEAVTIGE